MMERRLHQPRHAKIEQHCFSYVGFSLNTRLSYMVLNRILDVSFSCRLS